MTTPKARKKVCNCEIELFPNKNVHYGDCPKVTVNSEARKTREEDIRILEKALKALYELQKKAGPKHWNTYAYAISSLAEGIEKLKSLNQ